jgi:hypothetical protein
MRAGDQLKALRQVVEVRRLKRAGAEIQVAAAERARRELSERLGVAMDDIAVEQKRWAEVIAADRFSLPIVRAWSTEVQHKQRQLAQLDADYGQASARSAAARAAWRLAIGAEDAADELVKAAVRRQAREREEALTTEISDRSMQGCLRS